MKPIIIVADHPEIEVELLRADESMKFIKKQVDDLNKKTVDIQKTLWTSLEAYFEKKGILKDASKRVLRLSNGVIFEAEEGVDDELLGKLKELLKD